MATIRVRDWTKRRIEEIAEAESHSSHDSVIKSLLKDRELAAFAGVSTEAAATATAEDSEPELPEAAIDGMRALAELRAPENGLFFCWCPNCGNEVAHLSMDVPLNIDVFELECGRCLTQLDQHAIVAIELSYPLEEQLVAEALDADLRACVVDYWDRVLTGDAGVEAAPEDLVDRLAAYARSFGWEWPTDVPVVALAADRVYRDTDTGEFLRVEAPAGDDRSGVGAYVVRRLPGDDAPPADAIASGDEDGDRAGDDPFADATEETLDADDVASLLRERRLVLAD